MSFLAPPSLFEHATFKRMQLGYHGESERGEESKYLIKQELLSFVFGAIGLRLC